MGEVVKGRMSTEVSTKQLANLVFGNSKLTDEVLQDLVLQLDNERRKNPVRYARLTAINQLLFEAAHHIAQIESPMEARRVKAKAMEMVETYTEQELEKRGC